MSWLPAPPLWARLLMQLLWPGMAVLLTLVAMVVVPLGLLLWPVDRRLKTVRVMLLLLVYLWEDVGVLLECWLLRLRSPRGRSKTWVADHEELIRHALDNVLRAAKKLVGFHVELDGELDYGTDDRPLVVLSRHAGPADSLALGWVLTQHAGRVPRIVLADKMLWDPGIAAVLQRLDSFFVPTSTGAGDDRLAGVAELAETLSGRDALLIFPEGRNWTAGRQVIEAERLEAAGDHERARVVAQRKFVLPPKHKGVAAILAAQPEADVMVVAHTGLELLDSPRDIWDAIPLKENRLLIRGRTFTGAEVPQEPDEVAVWLEQQWGQVNAWVAGHVRHREGT